MQGITSVGVVAAAVVVVAGAVVVVLVVMTADVAEVSEVEAGVAKVVAGMDNRSVVRERAKRKGKRVEGRTKRRKMRLVNGSH